MNAPVNLDQNINIVQSLQNACKQIAPLWPLDRFVAVNPYLGLLKYDFSEATKLLQKVCGARSTLSLNEYLTLFELGTLERQDLAHVLNETETKFSVDQILHLLEIGDRQEPTIAVKTVTDLLNEETSYDWSRFKSEQLGSWLASYFDKTYAAWQPKRQASLFSSWKAEAEIDRTPELMGAKNFRKHIRDLPNSVEKAAHLICKGLGLNSPGLDIYLHRLLMQISGWSSFAARIVWEQQLYQNNHDNTLFELLLVHLSYEYCLFQSFSDSHLKACWQYICQENTHLAKSASHEPSHELRLLLQRAFEKSFQRKLITQFTGSEESNENTSATALQAVFCIDVRSEVFRRHLEGTNPHIETFGFAGFFGFPVETVPIGHHSGTPQCPVLLAPSHKILESTQDPTQSEAAQQHRIDGHLVKRAWLSFKMGAISCFSFVGPIGLAYLPKLISDSYGLTRTVPHPSGEKLGKFRQERTFDFSERVSGEENIGISLADQIKLAASALTGMSLTQGFARLVMLTGHGSTSVNNPHASGLDCGACGGRTGEANVRVAATILNDPKVRQGLAEQNIMIPQETFFLAAQHDTTTDNVEIFNRDQVPTSHLEELKNLEKNLAQAAENSRQERTQRLKDSESRSSEEWFQRSRDWAQTRPEWGLAGCASFIAAPRQRSKGLNLEGKAFLHSYQWQQDKNFAILELIMTAPMVVASWINLQYYASTVDPEIFGAGNKTLHNVVGGHLGVLEGNTGDLRVGLPWQSVHDGEKRQHEPIRLNVIIEAPIEAINTIIAKHEVLQQLLDNGWIHLFAINNTGQVTQQYAGKQNWCSCIV